MRGGYLIMSLLSAGVTWAQSQLEPHFSAQGMIGLPVVLNNPIFEKLTEVQGQLDGAVQMPLYKGLGIGAGVKGSWFGLEERSLSQPPTSGDVSRFVLYGKGQFERYVGKRTYYELYGKAGSSTWTWNCRTCLDNERQTALHWGAGASLFLHATDNLAFGITASYEADASSFGPQVIGLSDFPGHSDRGGPYRFFYVGLGFSTRFLPSASEGMW